ncbi:secreted protein [Melampsora americana]|nr:secreted protein [Melampsora americana]
MKSFSLIITLLQFLYVIGTPQNYPHLETRRVDDQSPAVSGLLYKRARSSPVWMTCPSAYDLKVLNLNDCKKVATHMASNRVACANYRSCALMTRADVGRPQAVQVTSATELRYAFSMYFDSFCRITKQVQERSKGFPKTVDGDLYLTSGGCDASRSACPTDAQVTPCSGELTAYLAALPL